MAQVLDDVRNSLVNDQEIIGVDVTSLSGDEFSRVVRLRGTPDRFLTTSAIQGGEPARQYHAGRSLLL